MTDKMDLIARDNLINEILTAFEKKMDAQDNTAEIEELKNKIANLEAKGDVANQEIKQEMMAKMDAFASKNFNIPAVNGANNDDDLEMKNFKHYLITGQNLETKGNIIGNNILGGYLAPTSYSNRIVEDIISKSTIRGLANIESGREKVLAFARNIKDGTFSKQGETTEIAETETNWGEVNITAERVGHFTTISRQLALGSAIDLPNYIARRMTQELARLENNNYIKGSGVGEAEGLLVNKEVEEVTSNVAGDINFQDLFDLSSALKEEYFEENLVMLMNRKTWNRILSMREDDANKTGAFLFNFNDTGRNGVPTQTWNGFRIVLNSAMPDIADNSYPILVGDINTAYTIYDQMGLEILVDNTSSALARKSLIGYTMNRFTGGAVIQPESIKKLKIKAS